jgi:hypothetical protein
VIYFFSLIYMQVAVDIHIDFIVVCACMKNIGKHIGGKHPASEEAHSSRYGMVPGSVLST